MELSFLYFLTKMATIDIFSKFQFFLIKNTKRFCFKVETIAKAFNARLSTVAPFSMFI